ncbi:conserved Plasmodium protein, unknown function [Plasmodium berghei]|uniref:Fam-b protein n=2 Tax=Plasmodium berghei TaxID=5821 RepID=A0A509AS78_PLABA|nr:conserved Plasmodium protein, unknown function [Plasmodium berghei ANKA]CXI95805.1 conserved Plasmodium protein, unknown function [Plasmodium berghei]SCL97208.1 conserved Plasmodium protein, unknown function [Plasmodium berghei]SCM16574.1 conserved Plasmodium protein, unknown function [Plasmodium berghei]SCM18371.1 conserved Plasmodium protein, unknown function [Plasmodium berghei]SCN27801.1 conserved Plasmodium protein, unknown function [Plasmodium berghei]|eukprot:XP_034423455.1 conserved Plasmodium protein, unknown function [Plasmodium berghei ANKA]
MKIIIIFCFVLIIFKNVIISKGLNDIPLINYEMVPSQRWKVASNELAKLKEKLKLFITSEIQKEESNLIRKYYKELLLPDEDNMNKFESELFSTKKEDTNDLLEEDTEFGTIIQGKQSFDANGPILLT